MRTPNVECVICQRPLYRRRGDLARVRYVACAACNYVAKRQFGLTDKERDALALGRRKGTNNRAGYKHRPESRAKASATHKAFWAANPELAKARGAKTRGAFHYQWKGGISRVNVAVRQMTENRRWIEAVKSRDKCCVRCGSVSELEAHHKRDLVEIISELGISSPDDARQHGAALWDVNNGETLCRPCHAAHHGLAYSARGNGRRQNNKGRFDAY